MQVDKFNTYHMTEPQVFYNREDVWAPPNEKFGGEAIQMEPYYVLMKLPGENRLGFLLMIPVTPRNRDNMIAWIAARSDFPGYGELIVYKLSKNNLILGPLQIEGGPSSRIRRASVNTGRGDGGSTSAHLRATRDAVGGRASTPAR